MSNIGESDTYSEKVKFLSDEMKRNWEYYLRLLDERRIIFDYFFRVIAIPAAIIGILTIYSKQIGEPENISFELVKQVLSFGIFTILVAAISAFIFYCIESRNAIYYMNSTIKIRDELKTITKSDNIKIPCAYALVRSEMQIKFFGASFWRGMIMSAINSAIASGLFNSFYLPIETKRLFLAFGFSLIVFALMYLFIVYWNQRKLSWY